MIPTFLEGNEVISLESLFAQKHSLQVNAPPSVLESVQSHILFYRCYMTACCLIHWLMTAH